jgi:hypothetical protein
MEIIAKNNVGIITYSDGQITESVCPGAMAFAVTDIVKNADGKTGGHTCIHNAIGKDISIALPSARVSGIITPHIMRLS